LRCTICGGRKGLPASGSLVVGSDRLILQFPASQLPSGQPYQQRACMFPPSSDGHGHLSNPQVERRKVHPHLCTRRAEAKVRTRGADTKDVVMEFGGQEPLASSPRSKVSPCPSCPASFIPQHLRAASSCGETFCHSDILEQPRTTGRSRKAGRAESFTKGLRAR